MTKTAKAGRRNSQNDLTRLRAIDTAANDIKSNLIQLGINEPPSLDVDPSSERAAPEEALISPVISVVISLPSDVVDILTDVNDGHVPDGITLLTLGHMTEMHKNEVLGQLAEWATPQRPVVITIDGYGRSSLNETEDVIWAAVRSEALAEIQHDLARVFGRDVDTPLRVMLQAIPNTSETPTITIPTTTASLDTIELRWGDERVHFPLGQQEDITPFIAPDNALVAMIEAHIDFSYIAHLWWIPSDHYYYLMVSEDTPSEQYQLILSVLFNVGFVASEHDLPPGAVHLYPSEMRRAKGSPVKILAETDDTYRLGGYGVVFGGRDLIGETFKATTDFGLKRSPHGMPVYYDHTFASGNPQAPHGISNAIGHVVKIEERDDGLWFEFELDRHQRYVDQIARLAKSGAAGLSTGSVSHLVRSFSNIIHAWPIAEISITPTPCEPRTVDTLTFAKAAPDRDGKAVHTGGLPMSTKHEASEHTNGAIVDTPKASREGVLDAPPKLFTPEDMAKATIDDLLAPSTEEPTEAPAEDAAPLEERVVKLEENVDRLITELPSIIETGVTNVIEKMRGNTAASLGARTPSPRAPSIIIDKKAEAQKHFERYLRTGRRPDREWAMKADAGVDVLNMTQDTQGGVLVPTEYSQEIIRAMKEGSLLRREGARIISVASFNEYDMPAMDYSGRARRVREGERVTAQNATLRTRRMRPYILTYETIVSNMLLNNPSVPILNEVIQPDMITAFDEAENEDFIVGTGTNEPQGLLTGGQIGVTTTGTAIAGDELLGLQHKLPEAHRSNGVWIMNDSTFLAIRKLKLGTGEYLFQQSVQEGAPSTLLGHRYIIMNSVPSIAPGQPVLIFADLRYFVIADFAGLVAMRLNERYAEYNETAFVWYKFTDAMVTLPQAVQILKMKD